jgi:hypothetical protein
MAIYVHGPCNWVMVTVVPLPTHILTMDCLLLISFLKAALL